MQFDEIAFMPAVELSARIRRREISPVEYMEALLRRIEVVEPRVNALAFLDGDRTLDRSKAAEIALMQGASLGCLHGVPATLKDLLVTNDMPTQYGSKIFAGNVPSEESPIVARLREHGAIIIGKTTTSEFGTGCPGVSRSPLTGNTHNPWKHGFNAGASSAGAAAAAGFVLCTMAGTAAAQFGCQPIFAASSE